MRPELIVHAEGFSAGTDLSAVASRRADILLRRVPGITRIRVVVILEKLPNGTNYYAARARVEGGRGETCVTEVAHDADAAMLRAFARLERELAGGTKAPAPAPE